MFFSYSARNKEGRLQTGTVSAASREGALTILQREGLVVTRLAMAEDLPWLERLLRLLPFGRPSGRELAIFTREFASLVSAKVPLLDSLRTLAGEERSPLFTEILSEIIGEIEAGVPLSAALQRHPQIFSPFYTEMVKSGELSGNLEGVLSYLAEYEEAQWLLHSRVRGALVYPVLIIVLAVAVAITMLLLVVPQLETIFSEVNVALPLPTRILIGASNFIVSFWRILLVAVVFVLWWLWHYSQSLEGRFFKDRALLRLPVFGDLFKKFYLARTTESLSTLIHGGIPLPQALEVTSGVAANLVFSTTLAKVAQDVRGGQALAEVFSQYPDVFPPFVAEMTAVGEKTGRVDATLATAGRFYRQEVDRALANITNLIEPILVVVLGSAVAILLAAILLPLYNLSKVL